MANTDIRRGLEPIRHQLGVPMNGQLLDCYVPSTYATALFLHDPVIVTSTANASRIGSRKAGTLPEVNLATAGDGNKIAGVIVGFEKPSVGSTDLSKKYSLASTQDIVRVNIDPFTIFKIQADSANAVAATDINANANIVYTHAGDTNTGYSGAELNTASMTTTATYQLKIMKLYEGDEQSGGNELGTNAKLEVKINNHFYANVVVGI